MRNLQLLLISELEFEFGKSLLCMCAIILHILIIGVKCQFSELYDGRSELSYDIAK